MPHVATAAAVAWTWESQRSGKNRSRALQTCLRSAGVSGIKRILFWSKECVDQQTLDECRSAGIETAVACPLMFLGSFLHRIHGFFAGVWVPCTR